MTRWKTNKSKLDLRPFPCSSTNKRTFRNTVTKSTIQRIHFAISHSVWKTNILSALNYFSYTKYVRWNNNTRGWLYLCISMRNTNIKKAENILLGIYHTKDWKSTFYLLSFTLADEDFTMIHHYCYLNVPYDIWNIPLYDALYTL